METGLWNPKCWAQHTSKFIPIAYRLNFCFPYAVYCMLKNKKNSNQHYTVCPLEIFHWLCTVTENDFLDFCNQSNHFARAIYPKSWIFEITLTCINVRRNKFWYTCISSHGMAFCCQMDCFFWQAEDFLCSFKFMLAECQWVIVEQLSTNISSTSKSKMSLTSNSRFCKESISLKILHINSWRAADKLHQNGAWECRTPFFWQLRHWPHVR